MFPSMKTLIAYLCGPINGCTDAECNDWRSRVKELWPGDTLDPMRRDYRGRETESYREIVELDKIDVMRSDVLIVSYDKPSVGTRGALHLKYRDAIGRSSINSGAL